MKRESNSSMSGDLPALIDAAPPPISDPTSAPRVHASTAQAGIGKAVLCVLSVLAVIGLMLFLLLIILVMLVP